MLDEVRLKRRLEGNPALLEQVLKPYKPGCRYLKSALLEYTADAPLSLARGHPGTGPLMARGRFSIPESCYIASTGHFNAVEYTLCYNQLGHYLLAECFRHRLLAPALDWTLSEYLRRQLSDCLLAEFSCTFHGPINSLGFEGWVSFEKVTARSKATFIQTRCGFSDGQGGQAEGEVLLALLS